MATVEKRTAVTKIRLSNHDLMIEKGRHQRLHLSQRNCPFCFGNLLENESYLLLRCSTFLLRKELFVVTKQFIPRFEFLSKDEQLKTLPSDGKIVISTGIFLHKALFADFYLMSIKTTFRCGLFNGLFNVNVIYILCRCVFL